jgi:uncharacterized membrane protein
MLKKMWFIAFWLIFNISGLSGIFMGLNSPSTINVLMSVIAILTLVTINTLIYRAVKNKKEKLNENV